MITSQAYLKSNRYLLDLGRVPKARSQIRYVILFWRTDTHYTKKLTIPPMMAEIIAPVIIAISGLSTFLSIMGSNVT